MQIFGFTKLLKKVYYQKHYTFSVTIWGYKTVYECDAFGIIKSFYDKITCQIKEKKQKCSNISRIIAELDQYWIAATKKLRLSKNACLYMYQGMMYRCGKRMDDEGDLWPMKIILNKCGTYKVNILKW